MSSAYAVSVDFEFWQASPDHAIGLLVEKGVLGYVPFGYCWRCNREGEVFDLLDPAFPVQPAICHDCLRARSLDFIEQEQRSVAPWT